jgi:hypothetical protein
MQDNQAEGPRDGYLREPQAQTEAGLTLFRPIKNKWRSL